MCSPVEMVGFTETAKCMMLRSCFEDAYKSPLSVIIVDDIERLLGLFPQGSGYNKFLPKPENNVLPLKSFPLQLFLAISVCGLDIQW